MPPGSPSPTPSRSAQEVIDTAIRENQISERMCLGLIAVFVVLGVVVVIIGAVQGNGLVAAAGSGTAALFWPALRQAVRIRETNMLLRLFEVPLNSAKTSREASVAIIMVFRNRFHTGDDHAAD
jgi:hypothetical protein